MSLKSRLIPFFILLIFVAPGVSRADDTQLTIAGFPTSTKNCILEGAFQATLKEYLVDINGRHAEPLKGNIFIVVEFGVVFKSANATLSSKDFVLKKGDVQFECAGFAIKTAPDKEPSFVWGDETTLSAGGVENFKRSHGRGGMTLVFTGPTSYANGTLVAMPAFPVKVKKTPTPKGSKGKKMDKKK